MTRNWQEADGIGIQLAKMEPRIDPRDEMLRIGFAGVIKALLAIAAAIDNK